MATITVRKGNVELDVDEVAKEKYRNLGYAVIDSSSGKVLEEAISNDVAYLQARLLEMTKENEKLKAEIATLKSKKQTSKKVD